MHIYIFILISMKLYGPNFDIASVETDVSRDLLSFVKEKEKEMKDKDKEHREKSGEPERHPRPSK